MIVWTRQDQRRARAGHDEGGATERALWFPSAVRSPSLAAHRGGDDLGRSASCSRKCGAAASVFGFDFENFYVFVNLKQIFQALTRRQRCDR